MLSILIPIYNCNVFPLVFELHKQCLECKIDFEILCQDDASNSNLNIENKKINGLRNCSFIENETNLAHRGNRNLLADSAKFKYLLFIDGDSNVIKNNYIRHFIDCMKDFDVTYGGRLHPAMCPSDSQKLRWKYGKFMEDKSVENRIKSPYQSLLFNNTVIKKSCFNKVKFDEKMKKYGHDDTQLSFELSLLKVRVNHIENPVEHGDIDSNTDFSKKMKGSLENLFDLYKEKKIDVKYVKLIRLFTYLEKTKLSIIVSKLYLIFEKIIFKNLDSKNPKLWVFNFFRVGYLCGLNK
jgi:hypothetical protein